MLDALKEKNWGGARIHLYSFFLISLKKPHLPFSLIARNGMVDAIDETDVLWVMKL